MERDAVKQETAKQKPIRQDTVKQGTVKQSAEGQEDRNMSEKAEIIIGDNDICADFTYRSIKKQGEEVHLTPTEYKIFQAMVTSPNIVFTREQLIAYAMEGDYDGYDRTIDSYIKEIRRKLEPDRSRPRYFRTVHGVGYRFVP